MPPHVPHSPAPTRRGPGRAWLETRGLVGGHAAPHTTVRLRTSDGVDLVADLLAAAPPPSSPGRGAGHATLLLHGFAGRAGKPAHARLAQALTVAGPVLVPDLRGHARSAGASGLGGAERHDVAAAVAHLRDRGHDRVTVVGVSMGGTAATNALDGGVALDRLVLVSAPAHVPPTPRTAPLRRLERVWRSRVARAGLRAVVGVRVVPPHTWVGAVDPLAAVTGWPGPLHVVHGADDPWFPQAHAVALGGRTGGTTTTWLEPGFGHGEDGLDADFCARLASDVAAWSAGGQGTAGQEHGWHG